VNKRKITRHNYYDNQQLALLVFCFILAISVQFGLFLTVNSKMNIFVVRLKKDEPALVKHGLLAEALQASAAGKREEFSRKREEFYE
jgi:hypothetical protein